MKKIVISDPTLRDGNHAINHQLNLQQIKDYAIAADMAGIPIVEVGHGNGIGASSLQIGESAYCDKDILETARLNLSRSKLGIHCMLGIATINKDLRTALDIGVDVVRVASHCTEADITKRHIDFVGGRGKEAYGCLMMTHLASTEVLINECKKMESYGAQAIILMDSAGTYLPRDVSVRMEAIVSELNIPIGFHAHNNLGLAIANSIAAVEAGVRILDGTARGFGAGSGNAQLEVLVAVLEKMGYSTGIDFYKLLDGSDIAEQCLLKDIPRIKPISIVSGLAGVFSGFTKHVERIALQYGVDSRDVFFELGKKKVVGGQEDLIIEVAANLMERRLSESRNQAV